MLKYSSICIVKSGVNKCYEFLISAMKIHCPNFVPKNGCFYQISVKVCPKQLAILRLCFLFKFLLFQRRCPDIKSTFALNFWLFHWKKVKNSTTCKNNEKLVEFLWNKGEFYSNIWNFDGLVTFWWNFQMEF